jgi:very-short-patch-repair endonuclease
LTELLAIAGEHYGLFTRQQARRCRVTDKMLQTRVRSGLFEQIATHVYRVSGAAETWHQLVLAACLAGGVWCVASHRTAACLHAYDGARPGPIDVTVPRGIWYRREGVVVHTSLDLSACDCTHIGPIPVTTPERTLIDLGAVQRWERVEEAFDGAERDATANRDVAAARHAQVRRRGRRGVGAMAIVLMNRPATGPQSVLERRFLRILDNASLPTPVCQFQVELPTGRRVYIDAAYPTLTLGFEIDGHGSHATRKQRAADNRRASALADLGWDLRRFTYEQVMDDGPAVVRAVRSAITARSCVS